MTAVSQILNWISDSLLLPVIVLLLAALFVSLVSLGGFCATYFQLLRQGRRRNELLRRIREQGELPAGEPGDGDLRPPPRGAGRARLGRAGV